MSRSQTLIASITGAVFVFLCAFAPVSAQQVGSQALEEIIVTAQKRDETLLEVPMSVTVLSGDLLEQQRVFNYRDLVALIPGLSISTTTPGITRVTLRGTNTGGVARTVGIYLDDVPYGSSSGLANAAILTGEFDTFDLKRVEVLRGPQGTLYGASALGGVMKYVTNAPNTEEVEFRGQASVESIDGGGNGYSATGVVNLPAGDTFAVRATGFYRSNDGYIDSIGNNPVPSLLDPNIIIIDGTRVEDEINTLDSFGGRVQALFQPSDNFSLNLMALAQNIETGTSDLVDSDPVTLAPLNDSPVRSRYQLDETDIEYRIYSATLDWDFGAAALQSVTSYATFEEDFVTDVAVNTGLTGGIPLAQFVTFAVGDPVARPLSAIQPQITSTDKFTQELRLVSDEHETFEWLVGLYYTDEDSGIDPQQILAVEAGTDTLSSDIPTLVEAQLTSTYEEIAAFANATWHVSPRFDLSFGARQSDNDQSASQVLSGLLIGGTINFDDATSSESPFTWSVSPRFEINDNMSMFARIATGFRPGGPNVIPPGSPPGTPGSYDSDELTSYELGIKSNSADGRFGFDVTAYFLDWEDVQLLAVVNGVGLNANGGTAESKGVEFAARWLPADGLTLALNGAYTDAYLTQDTDPIVGGLDGDPLSYVPEWGFGFDAGYEWTVFGDALAYVGGNAGYVGDRPTGFGNRDANGNIQELDAYTTINLRTGVDFGQWSVELYGRNVTDEDGYTNLTSAGALPNGAVGLSLIRPMTIGLSVGVNF